MNFTIFKINLITCMFTLCNNITRWCTWASTEECTPILFPVVALITWSLKKVKQWAGSV